MGDATHDEFVLEVIKAIQVFQDEPELPHQPWIFEVLFQVRVEFGDKEGVIRRQGGNKSGIQG
jgi:hypothetical protein